jgi:hypothetical protein
MDPNCLLLAAGFAKMERHTCLYRSIQQQHVFAAGRQLGDLTQCNAMSAAAALTSFKVIYHWGLCVLWGFAPVPKFLE